MDLVAQRFVDAWMAFPGLLLLLTIMSLVGRGLPQIIEFNKLTILPYTLSENTLFNKRPNTTMQDTVTIFGTANHMKLAMPEGV